MILIASLLVAILKKSQNSSFRSYAWWTENSITLLRLAFSEPFTRHSESLDAGLTLNKENKVQRYKHSFKSPTRFKIVNHGHNHERGERLVVTQCSLRVAVHIRSMNDSLASWCVVVSLLHSATHSELGEGRDGMPQTLYSTAAFHTYTFEPL